MSLLPEILFLTGDVDAARNDNHERLPQAFSALGWQVQVLSHEAVRIKNNQITIDQTRPNRFELIWLLGFGRQVTFFDRMQILRQLDQRRFVTTVDALMYLHGKHRWLKHMPETHTCADFEHLLSVVMQGGQWIVKPPAGSYGRQVQLVDGEHQARSALSQFDNESDGGYCLVQRFIPQIVEGEKRTLVAGGQIIGSYLRIPNDQLLANVIADGTIEKTSLSENEAELVHEIAQDLTTFGAGFAAIDIVYPYLIEVNVANPGGLATLGKLYGHDFAADAARALITRQHAL